MKQRARESLKRFSEDCATLSFGGERRGNAVFDG